MRWNVGTGAIARGKSKSTGYARKRKSVRAWLWTCGVKPTPKAVNTPWQHCIVHGLDKPGVFTTDSDFLDLHEVVQAAHGTHPGLLIIRFDNDPTRDMTPRQIVTAIATLESAGVPLENQVYILNHWR
jgi:hypothetical protein